MFIRVVCLLASISFDSTSIQACGSEVSWCMTFINKGGKWCLLFFCSTSRWFFEGGVEMGDFFFSSTHTAMMFVMNLLCTLAHSCHNMWFELHRARCHGVCYEFALRTGSYLPCDFSPTELDAMVFGHVFTLLTTSLPEGRFAEIIQKFPNLTNFCKRIDDRYFKENYWPGSVKRVDFSER